MADPRNPVATTNGSIKKPKPKKASNGSSPATGHNNVNTNSNVAGGNKEHEAIAHRISELEGIKDNEREQELEIEREVKKASREFSSTLSSLDNMAKVQALTKRSNDLLTSLKRLEREMAKTKRQRDQYSKERDGAKSELSKMSSKKDALEKLSRDSTNEVKKLRTDLQRSHDEDSQHRQHFHDRLQSMVVDVTQLIETNEQTANHSETHDTDQLFRQKFKSFVDQYELRELYSQSMIRSKDLELALQSAQLDQHRRAQLAESSRSNQLTQQVTNFSQTETELRSQLNIYVEKFKQVEDTLNSSNDLFLTFRKEMEEMSKKTKRLERENSTLTRKQDAMNANIIKMAQERTRSQEDMDLLRRRNNNLEKLCRGMQAQGRGQGMIVPREHPAEQGQVGFDDQGTESEYDEDEDDDDDEDEDENGYEDEASLEEDNDDSNNDDDDTSEDILMEHTATHTQTATQIKGSNGIAVVGAPQKTNRYQYP